MDERLLEDLQRQLIGRSWLYDDPASHRAGVEDALRALRETMDDDRARAEDRSGAAHTRRTRVG